MIECRPIEQWRYPPDSSRLDSAPDANSPFSRWSYRFGPPRLALRCDQAEAGATLIGPEGPQRHWDNPLEAVAWLDVARASSRCLLPEDTGWKPVPQRPPFCGGWVGFIGYDLGRLFESLPNRSRDDLDVPLFEFFFHDSFDARDSEGQLFAVDVNSEHRGALPQGSPLDPDNSPLSCNFTEPAYLDAVQRVIEFIRAGDVFQVNLSQRFTVGLGDRRPADIYKRLLARHPAWFGAALHGRDYALLCNSPELFLRVQNTPAGREILTRPIKGTRPLAPGMAAELRRSVKDQAELNMIVDLERNDLGRICQIGSVRVVEPRTIEAHATVYHGVAGVRGILREDVRFVDLLRAVFPGGSVTGAPKIRAMQIIEELEPVRRGPYCGAIGYLSLDGAIEMNVAIRTMIVERGLVHVSVGGGIVADSQPQAEYDETMLKATAMFQALGLAKGG